MSWKYQIPTGRLYSPVGELIAVGYSGTPNHKNDATAQSLKGLGPIPEGIYAISPPVDTVTHGPYVLQLIPNPFNEMYGRSGFLIHGDSVVAPGTASEGCVIMPRTVRTQIWASPDHVLEVVDEMETTT